MMLHVRAMCHIPHRELTKPTDRLVAIAGLADEVVSIMDSVYSYGLFVKDMHRGLTFVTPFLSGAPEVLAPIAH